MRGADLAQKNQEALSTLPLIDPRVQVYLARQAFPHDGGAMGRWVEEDAAGASLSSKFRAYLEDKRRTPSELSVAVNDTEALTRLLKAVHEYAPTETVH